MYERFTDRARKVMALANQEAMRFDNPHIGAEHILIALVKEGSGVGANVLKNLGVDLRSVRLAVEKLVKPGPESASTGKLPPGPRARQVVETAIEEARSLGHNYIGTEHLLLGVAGENEGAVAEVFAELNVKRDDVRAEVLNLLGAGTPGVPPGTDENAVRKLLERHAVGKAALELRDGLRQRQENAAGCAAYELAAEYRDMVRDVEMLIVQLGAALGRDEDRGEEEPPAEGGAARES